MSQFTGNEKFEIEHTGSILKVETMNLPGQVLFRVSFPSNRPPLVLCRATDYNQARFWTSIPEGRQGEAELIGPLIEQYFRNKQQ